MGVSVCSWRLLFWDFTPSTTTSYTGFPVQITASVPRLHCYHTHFKTVNANEITWNLWKWTTNIDTYRHTSRNEIKWLQTTDIAVQGTPPRHRQPCSQSMQQCRRWWGRWYPWKAACICYLTMFRVQPVTYTILYQSYTARIIIWSYQSWLDQNWINFVGSSRTISCSRSPNQPRFDGNSCEQHSAQ